MGWSPRSRLCARRFGCTWPFLLLLVHLVQRFPDYVVLCPVDRRTPDYVLGLWYRGDLGGAQLGLDVGRVLAGIGARLVELWGCIVDQASQGRGEYVLVRLGCLGALLVQRACKGLGVRDGDGLELLQGLEVAL